MARTGDQEAARAAYRNVRPGSDSYPEALGRIAWSLNNAGDVEGALKLAKDTVARSPKNSEALAVYADLLREAGKFPESAEVMDRLVAINADGPDAWRLYYLRGVSLERAGKWDAAQADLEQALKLNPNDPQVLNYLGFGWANRGVNLKQALELLQRAAILQPRSGEIIDSLGWARYRLGDYRGAVRDLERASSLAPYDPEVNEHLGDAYWRTDRKLEANYQWRRVLTLEADPEQKTRVDGKLAAGLPAEAAPPAQPSTTAPPPVLPKAPGGVTAEAAGPSLS
jgi:Flp pilus assembly protein TadD